jgi:hypothetical protein
MPSRIFPGSRFDAAIDAGVADLPGGTLHGPGRCLACEQRKENIMGRGLLLWLIGIPIPIILLVWLLGGLS